MKHPALDAICFRRLREYATFHYIPVHIYALRIDEPRLSGGYNDYVVALCGSTLGFLYCASYLLPLPTLLFHSSPRVSCQRGVLVSLLSLTILLLRPALQGCSHCPRLVSIQVQLLPLYVFVGPIIQDLHY